ncbi:MAG: hypothetical protein methR_P1794 [Methyloprofundus sp.]|nr:MAG: hypothetical protein methR_P1794 [Methyloprofundus sp.]
MINKHVLNKNLLGVLVGVILSANVQARNFFDTLDKINRTVDKSTPTQATQRAAKKATSQKLTEPTIDTVGYSKDFLKIKKLMLSDKLEQAYQIQEGKVKQEDNPDFLYSSEAGLLALDINKPMSAIQHFTEAEHYLKMNAEKSILSGAAGTFGNETLGLLIGMGELENYNGAPFERILMLNYKSIAYLLNGERKAYNVTRRAIDWQNIEHKEFEKSLALAEQKIAEEGNTAAKAGEAINSTSSSAASILDVLIPGVKNLFDEIQKPYKKLEGSAQSVSSAYVNPFGFYIAGIVQEFDSFEDKSLRDNARISYRKALKLNPKSKVLKQAIKEVKKNPRRGKRLVQVVIADGFAPEKKVLHFSIPTPGGIIPVKLPIYEPVSSKIAHIRIKRGKRTLATASVVADIEAITLRHQLDSMPFQHFKVIASITRSTLESIGWRQLGGIGMALQELRESLANPDMRSWRALPKRLLGARFYVSKKLKSVTIISYDKKWHRLATQRVKLPKNEHSFIYARTIDKVLKTNVNKTLWVKPK